MNPFIELIPKISFGTCLNTLKTFHNFLINFLGLKSQPHHYFKRTFLLIILLIFLQTIDCFN